jgi:hypothetical protein
MNPHTQKKPKKANGDIGDIDKQQYNNITNDFIKINQFMHIAQNPLKQYQNNAKEAIKQYPELEHKNEQGKYYNMNSKTPSLHALINLYKTPLCI